VNVFNSVAVQFCWVAKIDTVQLGEVAIQLEKLTLSKLCEALLTKGRWRDHYSSSLIFLVNIYFYEYDHFGCEQTQ